YNAITSTLADLLCESPVGDGTLRLRGTLDLTAQLRTYDLTIEAEEVPLNSVVRLLRQAKKQIPGDLTASGLLNAEFRATRSAPEDGGATGASPVHPGGDSRVSTARHGLLTKWTGNGSATNVHLLSSAGNAGEDEVAFGTIPLALVSRTMVSRTVVSRTHGGRRFAAGQARPAKEEKDSEPAEAHL